VLRGQIEVIAWITASDCQAIASLSPLFAQPEFLSFQLVQLNQPAPIEWADDVTNAAATAAGKHRQYIQNEAC